MENFVLRVAAEFSSRKEQLVFLINNYDMMLGVLMVTLPLPCGVPTACELHRAQHFTQILGLSAVMTEQDLLATGKGSQAPDPSCLPQEQAADDSKEVESFQQLLNARTQVGPGCGRRPRCCWTDLCEQSGFQPTASLLIC